MEDVYHQRKFRLLYTKVIDMKRFFQNYSELLNPSFVNRKKGDSIRALLGIDDDDEYNQLKQRMNYYKARNTYIPKTYVPRRRFLASWPLYELPSFETELVTLNNLKKESRLVRNTRLLCAKYTGKIVLDVEKEPEDFSRCRNLHPLRDYVICFRVDNLFKQRAVQKYKPCQELWVPGTMTLDRIKDRIICQEDYALVDPLVETPHQKGSKRKMDVNKFGMFYIGKDFYIDKRWGENPEHDYSVEVREWMKSKNLDPGSVKSMSKTQVQEIPLRLGYPYLYMHQGKCEHLITVIDARLLKYQDNLFREDYPLLKSFAVMKGRYCVLCLSRLAKLCVIDCDLIPYDTAFVCNMCALTYLYDSEGKKKSQFTLYKYIDHSAII